MQDNQGELTNRSTTDGFTLVELLIVIVILGILATVVVFAVGGVADRGQSSTCATDERTIATAVEAYFGQYDTATIPSGGSGLDEYELTLTATGLIRKVSRNWNVAADGSMTPQSGSSC